MAVGVTTSTKKVARRSQRKNKEGSQERTGAKKKQVKIHIDNTTIRK